MVKSTVELLKDLWVYLWRVFYGQHYDKIISYSNSGSFYPLFMNKPGSSSLYFLNLLGHLSGLWFGKPCVQSYRKKEDCRRAHLETD